MTSCALVCGAGCGERIPWLSTSPRTTCARCGELLDVKQDLTAVAAERAATWHTRFEARLRVGVGADASGVWSKREWVLPGLAEESIVTLGEGRTPLVPAPRLGAILGVPDLWIKQCGQSLTGSFKDLGMTVLVSAVVALRRAGAPIRAVLCASTGDTSAALAAYAAAADLPAIVLLPNAKITTAQLLQPLAHGALVLALQTDFDGCMSVVRELVERSPLASQLYLANSMNPLRIEGQKTAALEICEQLSWTAPDWIALPGGNLGNTAATSAGLEIAEASGLIARHTRLLVGQASAADPLARAAESGFEKFEAREAGATAASAIRIGNPVSVRRAIRALQRCGGTAESVTEDELGRAAAEADRTGLYVCPQTAVALAAVGKAARRGVVGAKDRVVVLATAHGLKFSEFKAAYHEGRLAGAASRRANAPIEVTATVDAAQSAIARYLEASDTRRLSIPSPLSNSL